jgi:hypothetical protein
MDSADVDNDRRLVLANDSGQKSDCRRALKRHRVSLFGGQGIGCGRLGAGLGVGGQCPLCQVMMQCIRQLRRNYGKLSSKRNGNAHRVLVLVFPNNKLLIPLPQSLRALAGDETPREPSWRIASARILFKRYYVAGGRRLFCGFFRQDLDAGAFRSRCLSICTSLLDPFE